MKIDKVELKKILLPFKKPFETSGWIQNGNYSVIVKLFSEGKVGWGESPVNNFPYYVEETVSTVWNTQKDFLIPLLLENRLNHPSGIEKLFSKIRLNNFAKAGIEFAFWDLYGKLQHKSLSEMIGGKRKKIPVGVSVGVIDDLGSLMAQVNDFVSQGYQRIKIKIKPGWDVVPLKKIRREFGNIMLQVDANGSYQIKDINKLQKLDEFKLLMIEQPFAADNFLDHAALQKKIKTKVCLDESIVSVEDAKIAKNLNVCKIINIKPARTGGLTEAKRIHDFSKKNNIPVWCGGMLETGIGRAVNLALASLPNFKLPSDISASSRYFIKDIIYNSFELNKDSTINVPDAPGLGIEVDEDYLERVTLEKLEIK
jgi:O-succinylbenzoate synthase